jgi:hypothetical protein
MKAFVFGNWNEFFQFVLWSYYFILICQNFLFLNVNHLMHLWIFFLRYVLTTKKYNFQIHFLLEACMGYFLPYAGVFLCANKAMLHYEICVQLIEIIKIMTLMFLGFWGILKLKSIRCCSILQNLMISCSLYGYV